MADHMSGDRSTNGAVDGQRDSSPSVPGPADPETLSDSEQTCSDSDQTLSDTDQTNADRDQTSADRDQLASDRDQAASDRDVAAGGSTREHDITSDIRADTAHERDLTGDRRDQTAQARLEAATARDATADARDVAALARDQAADARDDALTRRDAGYEADLEAQDVTAADRMVRGAGRRRRAAQHRTRAAEHRALAAEDRRAAAVEREESARERRRALVDREMLARQLAVAAIDPLTGARTRAAGLIDFDHELARARRVDTRLVVAYVDVVGLKTINDSIGHGAGDELLKRIASVITEHLRSYDLIIRLGGDEFLCAMSDMPLPEVRERFTGIAAVLAADEGPGAIRTGFAELEASETADGLIARADNQLVASRRGVRSG